MRENEEFIGLIAGRSGDLLTEAIHKKNFKVALIVGKEKEAGYNLADKVLVSDLKNKNKILEFFESLKIKKVIIGTGHRLAIELAEYLEANGIKLSIDLEKTKLCKNKNDFKKEIQNLGFETPKFFNISSKRELELQLDNIINELKFPMVIKSPIDIVEPEAVFSKEALLKSCLNLLEKKSNILLEEFIEGSDVTVPCLNDGKTIKILGILYWSKGKSENLKGFEKSKASFIENEKRVLDEIEKLVKKLNVIGMIRADIIVKKDKIYILEINSIIVCGNTGSEYCKLWMEKGFNFAKLTVENALSYFGEKI